MEVVMICLGLLSLVDAVNTQTDETHKNSQNNNIPLQTVVQKIVTEFGVLQKEHKELERKYSALLVELSFLRHKQDRTVSPEVKENDEPVGQPTNHHFSKTRTAVSNMQTNSLCTCLKGDKGDTGSPGPRGQNGYNGTDGIDGQAGDRGVKGDPGIPGFNGDDGVDGEKGDRGLKGDAGAIGLHGLKGDKGTTGPKGDEGIPGAKGIVGPKGQKGEPYQRAVDTTIAFTAGVIQQPDMHDSRSIIFNMVYTNVGGAYNKETGRFTCTIAGLYVFTWSTEVNQSRYIKSQLTVNGQNRAYLQVSAGIFSNSGCATIILQLNINDVVDVTPSMFSHGASLGASSSFSGHLLYSI